MVCAHRQIKLEICFRVKIAKYQCKARCTRIILLSSVTVSSRRAKPQQSRVTFANGSVIKCCASHTPRRLTAPNAQWRVSRMSVSQTARTCICILASRDKQLLILRTARTVCSRAPNTARRSNNMLFTARP